MSDDIWCFVKNLKDGKKDLVKCSSVYEITQISKNQWKREVLAAEDAADLKVMLKENPSRQYGLVEGNFMIKHFMIEVADSKKEMVETVTKPRPVVPKRLSTSDASIPLKHFLNYEEAVGASKTKKNRKENANVKKGQSTDILKRLQKKQAKEKSKDEGTTQEENKDDLKLEEPETGGNVKNKDDQLDETKTTKNGEKHKDKSEKLPPANVPEDSDLILTELSKNEENALAAAFAKNKSSDQHDVIKALKEKIFKLTNERDQSLATNMELNLKVDQLVERTAKLERKYKAAKEKLQEADPKKSLLEEIKNSLQQQKTSSCSSPLPCPLESLTYAVDLEEGFQDFQVPDEMIDVGEGKVVPKKSVVNIEDKFDTLNRRGEALFALIASESIKHYSLTGVILDDGVVTKPIPENVKTAISKILNSMTWSDRFIPNKIEMSKFFIKHPGDVRRRKGTKPKKPKNRAATAKKRGGKGNEENCKNGDASVEKPLDGNDEDSHPVKSNESNEEDEPEVDEKILRAEEEPPCKKARSSSESSTVSVKDLEGFLETSFTET